MDKIKRLPDPPDGPTLNPVFLESFINATRSDVQPGLTEYYIFNPDAVAQMSSSFDLSQITPEVFNQRLMLVLSTFWQIGFAPMYQTGGLTYPNNWHIPVLNTTNAIYTNTAEVYYTSWPWFVLALVASVTLLVAGVAGAIFDSQTIGPDILGFASSFVRNNKYVKMPSAGSTVGGSERARMLADVEVMLQDVRADADVGKVALGTVTDGTKRLARDGLYK